MHFIGDIYASEILGKPVLDPHGEDIGNLVDFIVAMGELFPRVSHLLVQRKGTHYKIPWNVVGIFNKKVISTTAPAGSFMPVEPGGEEILAIKNLLDKQIVDINGAKLVRVNDIKLGEVKGSLCLIAVDVGVAGIFRRLGVRKRWEPLARLMGFNKATSLISWNFLQPLEPRLSRLTLTVPRTQLGGLHPSDIAEIISDLSYKDRPAVVESLDIGTAAETIHELAPSVQADIIAQMDEEKAADILEVMPPDEAADLVGDLSDEKAHGILKRMDVEEAEDVQELLEHEEDTAGGLMTTEYLTFPPEMTVEEALKEYRLAAPDIESASVYNIYITDQEERLLGEVHLKDVLLAHPHKTMGEIMQPDFQFAEPGEDDMDAAETISKYNLLALPVIDADRKILGIITVDDVVDLLLPPQSRRKKHRMR